MGLDPSFSLTANDKNITAVISDRLMSLRVTSESEHQTDQLELTLWDTDPQSPLIKPPVGAVLALSLGTKGDLVPIGSFVVSSLSGRGGKQQATTMSIRARAAPFAQTPQGMLDLQSQRTRSWLKGTTIGAMVQTMAKDHGLKASVSTSLAHLSLQHMDQTDESDISFLQKLARHYDAIAKPADGRLLFVSRGEAQSASGKDIPPITLTPALLSSWEWNEDRHTAPGTVVAMFHVNRKATTHIVSIGSGDPVTRIKRKFRTEEDARTAATAEMSRRARGSVTVTLSLPGNASLFAGGPVILTDAFSPAIAGRWLIKSATHSLSKMDGFKTELTCEKANSDQDVQRHLTVQTTGVLKPH